MYFGNAFSLGMLDLADAGSLRYQPLSVAEVVALWDDGKLESCMGHLTEAYSLVLDRSIPMNRVSVALKKGESMVVGQYVGPRLEEGATVLPAGAKFSFVLVTAE